MSKNIPYTDDCTPEAPPPCNHPLAIMALGLGRIQELIDRSAKDCDYFAKNPDAQQFVRSATELENLALGVKSWAIVRPDNVEFKESWPEGRFHMKPRRDPAMEAKLDACRREREEREARLAARPKSKAELENERFQEHLAICLKYMKR